MTALLPSGKKIFHSEYLLRVASADSGLIVTADDLIAAGWLIEASYAKAEDDYEGPRITLTKAGQKLISKRLRGDARGRLSK